MRVPSPKSPNRTAPPPSSLPGAPSGTEEEGNEKTEPRRVAPVLAAPSAEVQAAPLTDPQDDAQTLDADDAVLLLTEEPEASDAKLFPRFAFRDDGALMLDVTDVDDRDLAGRELRMFVVLTDEERRKARNDVDGSLCEAADKTIARFPPRRS